MKKFISLILLLSLALSLASCFSGVSVPYYTLKLDNDIENVLGKYAAVKETLTYYENGEEALTYSVYIEHAENKEGWYNIAEVYPDYAYYAYENALYAVEDEKTYYIIQTDKTFYETVLTYSPREHILDTGKKFQEYSKSGGGTVEVSYYADITIIEEAELTSFPIKENDRLISKYLLAEEDKYYISIEYSVEHPDGTSEKLAERKFEYFDEKQSAIFPSLPDGSDTVDVTLVYDAGALNENRITYSVPRGIYLGVDTGSANTEIYLDEALTAAFDFESARTDENITLFVKRK